MTNPTVSSDADHKSSTGSEVDSYNDQERADKQNTVRRRVTAAYDDDSSGTNDESTYKAQNIAQSNQSKDHKKLKHLSNSRREANSNQNGKRKSHSSESKIHERKKAKVENSNYARSGSDHPLGSVNLCSLHLEM